MQYLWLETFSEYIQKSIYLYVLSFPPRRNNYPNKDIVKINTRNEIQCGVWSKQVFANETFQAHRKDSSSVMKVLKIDVIWWMIYIRLMHF